MIWLPKMRVATGLSEAADQGVEIVSDLVRTIGAPNGVRVDPDVRLLAEEAMSVEEYFATQPLTLKTLPTGVTRSPGLSRRRALDRNDRCWRQGRSRSRLVLQWWVTASASQPASVMTLAELAHWRRSFGPRRLYILWRAVALCSERDLNCGGTQA